jgi:hypothetical protein
MDVVTIAGIQYVSIERLMELLSVTSKKTIYNMVRDGRVEKKKLLNKAFFRMK